MRGNHYSGGDIRQAVAVLDLALAGVHAEMGEDLHDWYAAPKPVAPKAMQVVQLQDPETREPRNQGSGLAAAVPVARVVAPLTSSSPSSSHMASVSLPREAVRAAPAVVEVAAETWTQGEAGGVLLVVQGGMPDSRCVALAQAMLVAAGLKDMAIGWVGYFGKIDAKALMDAMRGMAPQQVLVLGQSPLGALLGRNLGVEGWHAATSKEMPGWDGVVGVTYPLDLLMKQSLFKRLAWQHLLAWGEDGNLVKGA